MFNRDLLIIAVSGVALVLISAWLIYDEEQPQWKLYQQGFKNVVAEELGSDTAAEVEMGIKQTWNPELGVTDRCMSCHMGMTWEGLEEVEQPYTTHPQEVLQDHPIKEYGCTTCHGGQGFALTEEAAHGMTEHWKDSVVDLPEIAETYGLEGDQQHQLVQINCNTCHRFQPEVEGMEQINMAKNLFQQQQCLSCHTVSGEGGNIGPDLTFEGDKSPHKFDFSNVEGFDSVFNWQVQHLKDPDKISPGTEMTDFDFNDEEARALAMLVMSWKDEDIPPQYLPPVPSMNKAKPSELGGGQQQAGGQQAMAEPGDFFRQKGCVDCHDVSVYGVDSAADIGPDLTMAYSDVQKRFGMQLSDFLHNPTGTMAQVLGNRITLSDEERDRAIELLKQAYEEETGETITDDSGGDSGSGDGDGGGNGGE